MLMASNRSLAEFNLSKQPELEEGKQVLKELSEQASQLCSSVRDKINEMRKLPCIIDNFEQKRIVFKAVCS